jgi:signal transduction histidine kinase
MNDNKIAILVGLNAKEGNGSGNIGYIFLGFKKSGNLYSSQDVRVMKAAADELVVAIQNALSFDKLQAMDSMKTEFIALTSHSLRTPLAIMSGNAEMLATTQGLSAIQVKVVEGMQKGVKKLSKFVNDLLAINSMQAGEVLSTESCTITDLITPLLEETREQAKAKGLTFTADDRLPDVAVKINVDLFREALRKVLENAVKFTQEGGVTVAITTSADNVTIAVSDTGIGIPEDEQSKLFMTFHRGTDPFVYDYEGKGIGLYFAKMVVEAHGGIIRLSSTPGKGARVEVELRLIRQFGKDQ